VLFSDEELEQKYQEKTELALSHRILNPMASVKDALKVYQENQIMEPPRNASFKIIWFYQKRKLLPFRTFLVLNCPAPQELCTIQTRNTSFSKDSIDTAQGCFHTTESPLNVVL